ncbi:hypothetical protein PG985_007624 [Apiospora marii]|uniref:Uncharacterized protein n=1 Tax=Apiospora marii TaxID=335849 RepID=A0ABR1SN38_9PEZI
MLGRLLSRDAPPCDVLAPPLPRARARRGPRSGTSNWLHHAKTREESHKPLELQGGINKFRARCGPATSIYPHEDADSDQSQESPDPWDLYLWSTEISGVEGEVENVWGPPEEGDGGEEQGPVSSRTWTTGGERHQKACRCRPSHEGEEGPGMAEYQPNGRERAFPGPVTQNDRAG